MGINGVSASGGHRIPERCAAPEYATPIEAADQYNGLITIPVASFGKKYVDFCEITIA